MTCSSHTGIVVSDYFPLESIYSVRKPNVVIFARCPRLNFAILSRLNFAILSRLNFAILSRYNFAILSRLNFAILSRDMCPIT